MRSFILHPDHLLQVSPPLLTILESELVRVWRFGILSDRGSSGMSRYGQQSIPNHFPMISKRSGAVRVPLALIIHSYPSIFLQNPAKSSQIPCLALCKLHRKSGGFLTRTGWSDVGISRATIFFTKLCLIEHSFDP